jgi:hypothetical protein
MFNIFKNKPSHSDNIVSLLERFHEDNDSVFWPEQEGKLNWVLFTDKFAKSFNIDIRQATPEAGAAATFALMLARNRNDEMSNPEEYNMRITVAHGWLINLYGIEIEGARSVNNDASTNKLLEATLGVLNEAFGLPTGN